MKEAKKSLKGTDSTEIKKAKEDLQNASYKLAEAIYKQTQTKQQQTPKEETSKQKETPKEESGKEDVVDAEYKEEGKQDNV